MTKPRRIPVHPISDYGQNMPGDAGIFVGRFEESILRLPNRRRMHRHEYFEIFRLKGRGTHFNDFLMHEITGHALVFVSPGQVHRWPDADGLRGEMICFTEAFLGEDSLSPPLQAWPFWFPDVASPVLALNDDDASAGDAVDVLLAEMSREFEGKKSGMDTILRAMLRALFVRAGRLYDEVQPTTPRSRGSEIVRQFHLSLNEHFRTTTSVRDYARMLKLSPDRLSEVVKDATGKSPGEIIRQRLLLEAQRLLAHTELNISEVAFALDFQDPAYFSRFFRRMTAQSPAEFRAGFRDEPPA